MVLGGAERPLTRQKYGTNHLQKPCVTLPAVRWSLIKQKRILKITFYRWLLISIDKNKLTVNWFFIAVLLKSEAVTRNRCAVKLVSVQKPDGFCKRYNWIEFLEQSIEPAGFSFIKLVVPKNLIAHIKVFIHATRCKAD